MVSSAFLFTPDGAEVLCVLWRGTESRSLPAIPGKRIQGIQRFLAGFACCSPILYYAPECHRREMEGDARQRNIPARGFRRHKNLTYTKINPLADVEHLSVPGRKWPETGAQRPRKCRSWSNYSKKCPRGRVYGQFTMKSACRIGLPGSCNCSRPTPRLLMR
jgi:hypothetical protein